MFSWIESEVLGMPGNEYLAIYGLGCVAFLLLVYLGFNAFRRFRFIDATATSQIRSAAQGQVELKGLGEWLPGGQIESPFSRSRCIWYHCTIDKKKRVGKNASWTNILDDRSAQLFRLVDETGDCVIDPDDAHVIPETDSTWYGQNSDARSSPSHRPVLFSMVSGRYRFRERLIRPATTLYALGWFRTLYNDPSNELIAKRTEELIAQWKLQPMKYLKDFDDDGNGKIQDNEWQAIRAKARSEVLARMAAEKTHENLLSAPEDRRLPYILSAIDEKDLVARKKLKAYASASGAFILFSALVVLYSIRPPLPL